MVAKMYSSADKVCIIMCVSTIMKRQNRNAPPNESIISKVLEWKNSCNIPPTSKMQRPANNLRNDTMSIINSKHS